MDAMTGRATVALLLAVSLLAACSEEKGSAAEKDTSEARDLSSGASDLSEGEDRGPELPPLPALVSDCTVCHDTEALAHTPDESSGSAGAWMAKRGRGLERFDPAIPEPGTRLAFPWTERGHHDGSSGCAGCHPTRDDGVGHGVRTYPLLDSVFEAGADCASSCHAWLPESATAEGFEDSAGERPSYEGSLRPGDLLAGAETAHSKLWREGARPRASRFRISGFNGGCGGCHNVAAEAHGTIPSCLDCHDFGGKTGETHKLHVAAIAENMGDLDVQADAAGLSFCAYCHVGAEDGGSRSRTVCYGCHLSGHQPMGKDGGAHFWPVP
jgi:hypothetical protein